ncbi:MAG: hypothetical protein DRQ55_09985 [Planctomycetota bacterium]|nr:MAG: hypothetical protein DRQ55_09985 [Planctomycetota bacterium]
MNRPNTLAAAALLLLLVGSGGACGPEAQPAPATPPPRSQGPRTVVLVSLDTLRPDRLGLYGGAPDVSPVMDELARGAVVFEQALASSPWTLPSHMTMLTGLDPLAHGVLNESVRLSPAVPTLAESLQHAGYTTAAFTDGGFVSAHHGFDQGFDHFDHERDTAAGQVNGFPRIMPEVIDWLGGATLAGDGESSAPRADGDLFLFLHTFDAHTPYDEVAPELLQPFRARPAPPSPDDHLLHWASHLRRQQHVGVSAYPRMASMLNDYDAGIREADLWLGRLVQQLKDIGRWEDTLLIVVSDHGESFFDHDLHVGHGLTLKDAEMRVPLIVRLPGGEGAGQRVPDLVGVVDIMRTVLEVEGLAAPDTTQGESLLGLVRGRERAVDWVLAESSNMRSFSLTTADYKYISPVGVKPLLIAERHLAPQSPPTLLGPREETVFSVKLNGADDVELRYDMAGDPLGLLDVLPSSHELYDRHADPDERRNLFLQDGHGDVVRSMVGQSKRRYEASQKLADEAGYLPEDYAPDKAQARVLATLGYVQSGDRDELKRGRVSKTMKTWVEHPHVAPDTTLLIVGDRAVHRLRVRLAVGAPAHARDAQELTSVGDGWIVWAAEHPRFLSRVDWRLAELLELADAGGIELPRERWVQTLRAMAP